jgi:hypothetical protein
MNATTEERAHALFSPSSAYTWIACKASTAAQLGQPDDSSAYADEGTAAHELMKWCLDAGTDTAAYMGRIIKVGEREFEVDDEMGEYVQMYVDSVRERVEAYELAGATVTLLVEQRLSIEHITGEKGAKGTVDTGILAVFPSGKATAESRDLKYGRGVEVSAVENYQQMMYASALIHEYEDLMDFDEVNLVIHQPRVSEKPSEWKITPAALQEWIATVAKPAAEQGMLYVESVDFVPLSMGDFAPGEKQCRFCKAKAVCPALAKHVEETIGMDFDQIPVSTLGDGVHMLNNDDLGDIYLSLDLIDSWAKAVRGRIEYELLNGNVVPGVKLVQGRRGARQWSSTEDAEALLKSMRLKQEQMYNFKLISPTQADKLLAKESPRRWKKVESLIVQRDGSPSVAPESDKRPALVIAPPADDFEVVADDAHITKHLADLETAAFGSAAADAGDDLC